MKILYSKLDICPRKCIKYSLPSIPICETNEEIKCSEEIYWKYWTVVRKVNTTLCPKSCETLEYLAKKVWFTNISNYHNGATHGIAYQHTPPETVSLYEEYFIHNEISLIAFVGGTLGMCIGFNFTNVVTCALNSIQIIYYDYFKYRGRNSKV